jgi:hypothetical protein
MVASEIIAARQNGSSYSELARFSGQSEMEVKRINQTMKFDDTTTKPAVVREIEANTSDEAAEINNLHKKVCGDMRTVLEKAVRVGELLIAQKAKLPHGGWDPWIKANLSFSAITVRRYIQCYNNRELLKRSPTIDLTIEQLAKGDKTKAAVPKQPKTSKPITFTHVAGSKVVTVKDPPLSWHIATRLGFPNVIVCRKCWEYTQGVIENGHRIVACACKDSRRDAEIIKTKETK